MKKTLLSLAITLMALSSYAADYYWKGSNTSTDWSVLQNWVDVNGNAVTRLPGPDDRVFFNSSSGNDCRLSSAVTISDLVFNYSGTHALTINGSLTITNSMAMDLPNPGSINGSGAINVGTATALADNVQITCSVSNVAISIYSSSSVTLGTSLGFAQGNTFTGCLLAVTASSIQLNGAQFIRCGCNFTQTGSTTVTGYGGNSFDANSPVTLTNTGNGTMALGNNAKDIFMGPLTIQNNGRSGNMIIGTGNFTNYIGSSSSTPTDLTISGTSNGAISFNPNGGYTVFGDDRNSGVTGGLNPITLKVQGVAGTLYFAHVKSKSTNAITIPVAHSPAYTVHTLIFGSAKVATDAVFQSGVTATASNMQFDGATFNSDNNANVGNAFTIPDLTV